VSQAANDLNFTFVVDEDQADRLVDQFHDLLIQPVPGDRSSGRPGSSCMRRVRLHPRPRRGGDRSARP
jgi:hypothetical protein